MAIQYSDNVFSGNMPFEEAKEKFLDCIENNVPVQALHYGTDEELNSRKQKADMEAELKKLKDRIDALEPAPKSDLIHMPTTAETKISNCECRFETSYSSAVVLCEKCQLLPCHSRI